MKIIQYYKSNDEGGEIWRIKTILLKELLNTNKYKWLITYTGYYRHSTKYYVFIQWL